VAGERGATDSKPWRRSKSCGPPSLLDIELPGLTGFEAQSVQRTVTLPLVIFVTGYDQHALAAFDCAVLREPEIAVWPRNDR
jgi:DNA-binding LytR/AlgR family response regulator